MTWQPIETAPRDGTWVLLTGGTTDFKDEREGVSEPPSVAASYQQGEWLIALAEAGSVGVCYDAPARWMPLPEFHVVKHIGCELIQNTALPSNTRYPTGTFATVR